MFLKYVLKYVFRECWLISLCSVILRYNWTEAYQPARSDNKESMVSELEETQRIEDEPHGHVASHNESEDEQWFLAFNERGRHVFLKHVVEREVVEDIGNRHGNIEFGFKDK